ncbi:hypothetical protein B1H18_03605 [Streptomyces tsukubensis]|uniref:Uncharacterized protein n=1 Tax=Streptomyces tsukubensis TaxID=83656 RepID=A0A1V4ADR7_9ACTN|nr:hypothetical protein B1H18_03605 [Streptomyces tsukubensis]
MYEETVRRPVPPSGSADATADGATSEGTAASGVAVDAAERPAHAPVSVPVPVPEPERRGCLFALSQPPLMLFLTIVGTLILMGAVHDLLLL